MTSRTRVRRAVPLPDEKTLLELEDNWLVERHRGSSEQSRALLHDNYAGGDSFGARLDKTAFLAGIAPPKAGRIAVSQTDRSMRRFGDTVISTGVAHLKTPASGHAYRYLRVYHREPEGWRLVASQSAPVRQA